MAIGTLGTTRFEEQILDALLRPSIDVADKIRQQLAQARVMERKITDSGFHTHFVVAQGAARLKPDNFQYGNLHARLQGLEFGAGFLLFIRSGFVSSLEGYSYEPWPEHPVILAFEDEIASH